MDSPETTTRGRYYFTDPKVPFVNGWHNYGSRSWHDKNVIIEQGLGEDPTAKQHWDSGEPPPRLPNAEIVGDAVCLALGEHIDHAIDEDSLVEGFPAACFLGQPDPNDPWIVLAAIFTCPMQYFYATMESWSYDGLVFKIETAFRMLLGFVPDVNYHAELVTLPGVTTVILPTCSIGIVNGTANFQQLATQAMQLLVAPTNWGNLSTLNLWYQAAIWTHQLLSNDGADPTKPVVLVGHSYGAVAASILAAMYQRANPLREVRLLTFGSPKPGDSRLRTLLLEVPSLSLANDDDIVTVIAPDRSLTIPVVIALGAPELFIWDTWAKPPFRSRMAPSGALTPNADTELDSGTLLIWAQRILASLPPPVVNGHLIDEYRARILRRCPEANWPIKPDLWLFLQGLGPIINAGAHVVAQGKARGQAAAAIHAGAEVLATGPVSLCGWHLFFPFTTAPLFQSAHPLHFPGDTLRAGGIHVLSPADRCDMSMHIIAGGFASYGMVFAFSTVATTPLQGYQLYIENDHITNKLWLYSNWASSVLANLVIPSMDGHDVTLTLTVDRTTIPPTLHGTLKDITGGGATYVITHPCVLGDNADGQWFGVSGSAPPGDLTSSQFSVKRGSALAILDLFVEAAGPYPKPLTAHTPNFQEGCTPPYIAATINAGVDVVATAAVSAAGAAAIRAGADVVATAAVSAAGAAAIRAAAEMFATAGHATAVGAAAIRAGADVVATATASAEGAAAIRAGVDVIATG